MDTRDAARALRSRWLSDPVSFAREALGYQPWERQCEMLRACVQHPRVSIRSGHKVSKTRTAATIALWFWLLHQDARVIMTSASGRQVTEVLWREIQLLHQRARHPLGGELHEVPSRGLRHRDGRQVLGFTTNEPERMSGFSGANMLYIIDEASGVPEAIFEAIEGNRAGGARTIMLSNPTRLSGTFYESHTTKRAFWHTMQIASTETPNCTGAGPSIAGLADPEWIAEKGQEWGEESPSYRVRVLGEFPDQESNCIVPLSLVDRARDGWVKQGPRSPSHPLAIGVDVARFGGDETVIWPRRGPHAYEPVVVADMDSIQVADKVMEVVHLYRRPSEKPSVRVDVIGVGAGVVDQLQRHGKYVVVVPVNVAERSDDPERFYNLRAQLWFGLRDWLAEEGYLPSDSKLEGELVSVRYGFDSRGRIKVEPKDELRKRIGRSPDRADALALAVYNRAHASPAQLRRRVGTGSDAGRLGRMF